MKWLLIIFGILSNVFASVLFKVAMMPPRKMPSLKDPLSVITNIPLWSGLSSTGWRSSSTPRRSGSSRSMSRTRS